MHLVVPIEENIYKNILIVVNAVIRDEVKKIQTVTTLLKSFQL